MNKISLLGFLFVFTSCCVLAMEQEQENTLYQSPEKKRAADRYMRNTKYKEGQKKEMLAKKAAQQVNGTAGRSIQKSK